MAIEITPRVGWGLTRNIDTGNRVDRTGMRLQVAAAQGMSDP